MVRDILLTNTFNFTLQVYNVTIPNDIAQHVNVRSQLMTSSVYDQLYAGSSSFTRDSVMLELC